MIYTLLDINTTILTLFGYPLSYVELLGTVFGLLTVILAVRANIWTWPTGILNEIFFFIIFFQVQLYANMFLQVIFLITTLYGWYNWSKSASSNDKAITSLPIKKFCYIILMIAFMSLLLALFIKQLHTILPNYFIKPAAYPYTDATVMMISIYATLLLAQKKIQTWTLWIINNILCITLYFHQGIYFIAIEYIIFLIIAITGLIHWNKLRHHQNTSS